MKLFKPVFLLAFSVSACAMDLLVSWLPSPSAEMVTGYQVYSSTNAFGQFTLLGVTTGTNLVATVPETPTTYFVVTATNLYGQSNPSAVASLDSTNFPTAVSGVTVIHPFVISNVITINVNERLKR